METRHKKLAWAESAVNVSSGLLLSVMIFQPIIFSIYNIKLPLTSNIQIALWFTVISIVRGYVWRRWFHKKFYIQDSSIDTGY